MIDADERHPIDRLSAVCSAGGSQCRATTSSGMSSELTTEYRDWLYICGRERSHSPDNKKHESKFVNVEMNLPASIEARTMDADTYDCLRRRDDDDECDPGESSHQFPNMQQKLLESRSDFSALVEQLWSSSCLTIHCVVLILLHSYQR